jgi:uncharacterized protein (DUF433 family)
LAEDDILASCHYLEREDIRAALTWAALPADEQVLPA